MGRTIYKAEEANDPTYKAEYVNEDKDFDLDSLLEEINNLDEKGFNSSYFFKVFSISFSANGWFSIER